MINELKSFGLTLDIYDPHAEKTEVLDEYDIELTDSSAVGTYDAIVLAVAHNEFNQFNMDSLLRETAAVYDVKGFLNPEKVDKSL